MLMWYCWYSNRTFQNAFRDMITLLTDTWPGGRSDTESISSGVFFMNSIDGGYFWCVRSVTQDNSRHNRIVKHTSNLNTIWHLIEDNPGQCLPLQTLPVSWNTQLLSTLSVPLTLINFEVRWKGFYWWLHSLPVMCTHVWIFFFFSC